MTGWSRQSDHSVLDSILMFTGLLGGQAAYTWSDWAQALGWSGMETTPWVFGCCRIALCC